MRVHNLLPQRKQLTGTVERGEPHPEARERVDAALLAVDDAHGMPDHEPGLAYGLHRLAERAARQGVNPRTGERVQIAAANVPKFSAGSQLKKAVN
jgi:hypothetical protein